MISARLWQSLMTPFVAHPIYWRNAVWKPPEPPNTRFARWRKRIEQRIEKWQGLLLLLTVALGIVVTILYGPSPLMLLFFGIPLLFLIFAVPVALLSVGTIYGLACALRVSDRIAHEQLQGRYTLLGLTAQGFVGATWALCSLELHTNSGLKQMRYTLNAIFLSLGTLMTLPIMFAVIVFASFPQAFLSSQYFTIIGFAAFILIPLTDYIQSTIIGCIVGMITPTYTRGRANVRVFTISIFLTLQSGTYLVAAFFCLLFWPSLLEIQIGPNLAYIGVCLITLYICREILIVVLWLILAFQLETGLKEMHAVTHVDIVPLRLERRIL